MCPARVTPRMHPGESVLAKRENTESICAGDGSRPEVPFGDCAGAEVPVIARANGSRKSVRAALAGRWWRVMRRAVEGSVFGGDAITSRSGSASARLTGSDRLRGGVDRN